MNEKSPIENLPNGYTHLYGSLFTVPFSAIQIAESDPNATAEYRYSNPRMNTENGTAKLMDKAESALLRESIKIHTLLNPPICRWVNLEGKMFPQLVGGDRRYRAIDFLIRKKEIVTDPRSLHLNTQAEWEYKKAPADEAYATLACQVFAVSSDLEALALAWAENKNRINLTDGHEVAEVFKLRKFSASDERILEILQRDEKWLAETDSLIANLDENTLADLIEGRMTRSCAAELLNIDDVDLRDKVRISANATAIEKCENRVKRIQKQLEQALDQREIADGAVAVAEFRKDGIEDASEAAENADLKVQRTVKERNAEKPVTSPKQVREAKAKIIGKQDKAEDNGEAAPRMLRAAKVKEGLQYLDSLIRNAGKDLEEPSTFIANIDALKAIRRVINNNIMANEPDFRMTIKLICDSVKK